MPVSPVRRRATLGVLLVASTWAVWPVGMAAARVHTAGSLDVLRAEADAATLRLVDTLGRYEDLGRRIDAINSRIPELEGRIETLRADAVRRAVVAYVRASSTTGLPLLQSNNALAAQRRSRLINRLNALDASAARALQAAAGDLAGERSALRDARRTAEDALATLRAQDDELLAKVAAAEREAAAQVAAQVAAQAAAQAATTPTTARPAPATAPAGPTTTAPPSGGSYSGTPGTHPRHAEPFLVCLRQHESDGTDVNHDGLYDGGYRVVNPAGPFLGAYQFLQATWASTASHMGRPELIGVPANTATPYDQDDVAWALYQWMGARPWGNLCVTA